MAGRDKHPYSSDDIGELIGRELADIEVANRQNDRGTDELARGRRLKRFEERMYRGGKVARRFEQVSPENIKTLMQFPTLRLWVLCAGTLGYFPPADESWRRVDLMNDDPCLLDDESTRDRYTETLAIQIVQRAALAAQNLEEKGGVMRVQRRAEDRLGPADDYVKQSDFWSFAADRGWTVPEYAKTFLSAARSLNANQRSRVAIQETDPMKRADDLSPLINEAIQSIEAKGAEAIAQTVFQRLREFAEKKRAPFTGEVTQTRLYWLPSSGGKKRKLTVDAVRDRLRRRKEAERALASAR